MRRKPKMEEKALHKLINSIQAYLSVTNHKVIETMKEANYMDQCGGFTSEVAEYFYEGHKAAYTEIQRILHVYNMTIAEKFKLHEELEKEKKGD